MNPALDFVVRAVTWIGAIALWTSLNKPDDIPVVPVWSGAPTVIGAIILATGVALYSAGALTVARAAADTPHRLLTEGPFAYVRNPIYLGAMIVMVGLTVIYRMPAWTCVKLALLFTGGHLAVVLLEEPRVRKRFGAGYGESCRDVPRWNPPFSRLRRRRGGVESTSSPSEDPRGEGTLMRLVKIQDLRATLRLLRQQPFFAASILGMLGLGVGAATAIFSVVYGVLLKPLPFPQPDRIVQVWGSSPSVS